MDETIGTTETSQDSEDKNISFVLIALLKGPLYSDASGRVWYDLLKYCSHVREYFSRLGLELILDEDEGFAFLRQNENDEEEKSPLPRLVKRHPLSFHTTLLCALLRKKILELDTYKADSRPIITKEDIIEMMQMYYPQENNEVKVRTDIERQISKVQKMGLLRPLKTGNHEEEKFEILRVIKALINAEWLAQFLQKLKEREESGNATV